MSKEAFVERATEAANEARELSNELAGLAVEASRLASYRELQKELRYLETRQSETAQRAEKQKWRNVQREYRRFTKKHKK